MKSHVSYRQPRVLNLNVQHSFL